MTAFVTPPLATPSPHRFTGRSPRTSPRILPHRRSEDAWTPSPTTPTTNPRASPSTNDSSCSFHSSSTFCRPIAGLPPPQPPYPPGLPTPDPHHRDDDDDNLAWKDRVALYAQFSAEETLEALLDALRDNNSAHSGPRKDDGIDALYAFANLDIWALSHRFFGKRMDLGQFERFKRVVVAAPYDVLLRPYRTRTLSALHVRPDVYVTRRGFEFRDEEKVFTFSMSKTEFGTAGERAWMVDSIICESVQ